MPDQNSDLLIFIDKKKQISMAMGRASPTVVAVLGAAAIDMIARVAEFPPADGIVIAEHSLVAPGGSGGNVAEGLARLGYPVRFLGILGDDENGRLLLSAFREAGVDTSTTRIHAGGRSASCFIAVNPRGERLIFSLGGMALYENPEDIQPDWLQNVKILYLADAYPNVALAALNHLEPDARVVFNPGGLMTSLGMTELRPLLRRTQVLITNQVEAKALTGENDIDQAARQMAGMGPAVVIVTLGGQGSLLFTGGEITHHPGAPALKVVDTTGAGDAFSAGVVAGMLEGFEWNAIINLASEVAAIKVQNFGSRAGLPSRNQVNRLAGKITMNGL
ncbi:MAG: carbohydrate kinase family protein [Anaerolineae bacterium]|nr:carbohydrate kinase family protein [Anaerolineae bacterium]